MPGDHGVAGQALPLAAGQVGKARDKAGSLGGSEWFDVAAEPFDLAGEALGADAAGGDLAEAFGEDDGGHDEGFVARFCIEECLFSEEDPRVEDDPHWNTKRSLT